MKEGLRVEEVRGAAKVAADLAREEKAPAPLLQLLDEITELDEPELRTAVRFLAALLSSLVHAERELKKDHRRILASVMKKRQKPEMN